MNLHKVAYATLTVMALTTLVAGCSSKRDRLFADPLLTESSARIAAGRATVADGERLIREAESRIEEGKRLKKTGDSLIDEGKDLKKLGHARLGEGETMLNSVELLETAERMRLEGEAIRQ